MALSAVVKETKETTVKPAVATAQATKAQDSERVKAHEEFKNKGESIGQMLTEEQRLLEGTKRASIQFIRALGNPKQKQDRVSKGAAVGSYKPIGYLLKALEDITIKKFPLKANCVNLIDVNLDAVSTKTIKAGEEFEVNIRELGDLISKTEFNGFFTGGGKEVYLGVTFSGERTEPLPILKAKEGSIKENMELVATETVGADGKKTYTVLPQYEETFGVLFTARKATRTSKGNGGRTSEQGQSAANIARALQDYYATH